MKPLEKVFLLSAIYSAIGFQIGTHPLFFLFDYLTSSILFVLFDRLRGNQ